MPEPLSGRSLPWFRVDVDLVDHPKLMALAEVWGVSEAEAGWAIIRLWAWTMRYAARGRLADGADSARGRRADGARTALERACGVGVPREKLISGLVQTGWLDQLDDGGWEIHDWAQHNGAAVVKAEKDADRKRAARARRSNVRGLSADRRADGAGNGTGRDGTGQKEDLVEQAPLPPEPFTPSSTDRPGETQRKKAKPRPMTLRPADATQDEWDVFAHWRERTGKKTAALDPKRLTLIRRWLATEGVTVERMQRAIDGCVRTPWNSGLDPASGGRKYLELSLIFRDASNFERFESAA